MSHTRVGPFAANQKLTSAAMNTVDLNASTSCDTTVAGDSILGNVTFTGASARCTIASGGLSGIGFVSNAGSVCSINGQLNVAGAGSLSVGSGASFACVSGAVVTMPLVAGSSITLGTGATITTTNGSTGQIILGNGLTDIKITPAGTRTVDASIAVPLGLATGWNTTGVNSPNNQLLCAPNTGVAQQVSMAGYLHDGATLASVKMYIIVLGSHAAVPAVLPSFNIFRRTLATNAVVSLGAGYAAFPTPASGPAWDASGAVQSWTFTATQNQVIDKTQYAYAITLFDESGANSVAGNTYLGMQLNYTTINDARFQ